MADYSDALKQFLEANGEGAIPQQQYQLLEFLKANVAPTAPAPVEQAVVSAEVAPAAPMDINTALSQFVKNKTEAAPGNSMEVRTAAINREHGKNGIVASVDSRGQPVFENVPIVASTPDQKSMATNVHGLIDMLRSTNDVDKASGIRAQLNVAMAEEQARMYTEAQKFANNKLQVPLLEQQLADNMALDKQAADYVMGMGDSPITMKIRNALEDSRGKADAEAKRYLQGNMSFNGLIAAEKTASAEFDRIAKKQDLADRAKLSREATTQERADRRQDVLEEEAKGLMDEQKLRLRILHPQLNQSPDTELVATFKQHRTKGDGYTQAIDAMDEDLPKLAVTGNTYAKAILLAKEEAEGIPKNLTEANLKALKDISLNDAALKKGMAIQAGGMSTKDLEKNFAAFKALNAPGGATKEQKEQYELKKLDLSMAVLGQVKANEFKNDVTSWAIPDPAIQQAIIKTQTDVNKKDMLSVLTTYVGNAQGKERQALVANFTNHALTAASRTKKSRLAAIDPNLLKNEIETAETRSLLAIVSNYITSSRANDYVDLNNKPFHSF